jgi:Predicted metal-binding integral membrane protein (DUF2182)
MATPSPFAFFLSSWRGGPWGAFSMGARHGIYCAGCCWALMGLSFVFGVMARVLDASCGARVMDPAMRSPTPESRCSDGSLHDVVLEQAGAGCYGAPAAHDGGAPFTLRNDRK